MRYRLRTLLIVLALGPPLVAGLAMLAEVLPTNPAVVAAATYIGLVAALIAVSHVRESRGSGQAESTETFDRQIKEADRQMEEQARYMRRADELVAKQESNAERLGRLLEKMEEQSRRQDAILDAKEKQLGLRT
jgi:hypothetical protein